MLVGECSKLVYHDPRQGFGDHCLEIELRGDQVVVKSTWTLNDTVQTETVWNGTRGELLKICSLASQSSIQGLFSVLILQGATRRVLEPKRKHAQVVVTESCPVMTLRLPVAILHQTMHALH